MSQGVVPTLPSAVIWRECPRRVARFQPARRRPPRALNVRRLASSRRRSGRLVMRRRQRRLNAAKRRRRLPHHTPTLMWLQWWERRLDPFLSAVAPFLSVGRADRTCQSALSLPSPAAPSTSTAVASARDAYNLGVASEAGAEAGSGLRQLLPSLLPTHARLRARRADAQRRRARRAYHPCASATAQRRGLGQHRQQRVLGQEVLRQLGQLLGRAGRVEGAGEGSWSAHASVHGRPRARSSIIAGS